MTDQIVEWLSEKFGDELRSWLPTAGIFACVSWVLLVWSGKFGCYQSALLNLMRATPEQITKEGVGVTSLPFFIFLLAIGGTVVSYSLTRLIAKRFFRYVCDLPTHRAHVEQMMAQHKIARFSSLGSLLDELREAEQELSRRRGSVRVAVRVYEWSALLGASMFAAAFWGNMLDASIGILLFGVAGASLYQSVGTFLSRVTPWYAKVQALAILRASSHA